MKKQGGFLSLLKIIIILALASAGFFCTRNIYAVEKININTATPAELDSLPGIGAAKAQAIIDYRAVQPFVVIEDIMKVTGIKQATFDGLKDLITVGEAENTNLQTSSPPSPSQGEGVDNIASSTEASATAQNSPLEEGWKYKPGDVVINELVSDPTDNEAEWVELYNRSGREIDLTGWRLEDGSKAKTSLSGSLERYKIIEKPNGNLNNGGDLIALYDNYGKIIDQVAYGNWPDGDLDDNAPAAPDPYSMARKFDGYNGYNNFNDFAVTLKPTKGAANIIQAEDEVSIEAKAKFDFSNDIFITEILPNPAGDDVKNEFIEIFNAGRRSVDLIGWSLSNEDGKKKFLENMATSTVIGAGEYLLIYRTKSKLVLHNDAGEVRLYEPLAEKPMRIVKYKEVKSGWSYNLTPLNPLLSGGIWEWSESVTPGAANAIKTINRAPEVEFSFKPPAMVGAPIRFDSTDTVDDDGDSLTYNWDFGDGMKNSLASPEHVYLKIGIYQVKLAVSDGKDMGEKEKSIKVVGSLAELNNNMDSSLRPPRLRSGETGGNDNTDEAPRNDKILINEIFPNPKGADTGGGEWLELFNQSAAEINLLNWRLENQNGKYKFNSDLLIQAGEFYVLDNSKSKLALKNSLDDINLYNGLDELADSAAYAEAVEGESYARGANGNWFWTTKVTPGAENVISVAESRSGIMNNESRIAGKANVYIETNLEAVREMEIGSLIKLKGTVAVEPGILGTQIFYIVGSPGLQVYNYKKDFPELRLGDNIEVTGELALAQGELRIKTKAKTDIIINEHKAAPPALAISADQANEENVGRLITVSGEITDKKSSTLYLDDGNDEILVYIKQNTGITTKALSPGQSAAVTGILSKTAGGLRLLPRYQSDIAVNSAANRLEPQVLGEVAAADEWALAERDKKAELFKYLLIIAAGFIIILGIIYLKVGKKIT